MIAVMPKSKYTYKVPLLGNMPVSFRDAEPDSQELPIAHIDMDITERCNLACSYCFKGKLSGKPMGLETAKQAIKFLVWHSQNFKDLGLSLVGGEPLLAFDLLKEWLPWTRRYCEQRNKRLPICITTNGTLFTKEHHDFFRKWGIGLHLSFDGCPEVQNFHRKFRDGRGTAETIEKNLPLIFSCWRTIHARSTVTPETVDKLAESYKYFCKLGFLKVAFALDSSPKWNLQKYIEILKDQFRETLNYHWKYMKEKNQYFVLSPFDGYVRSLSKQRIHNAPCAAGNSSLLVDIHGFLWPCHRFSSSMRPHKNLILGNIWGGFNNRLRNAYISLKPDEDFVPACKKCKIRRLCYGGCIGANWQNNSNILKPNNCRAQIGLHKVFSELINKIRKTDQKFWDKYLNWLGRSK